MKIKIAEATPIQLNYLVARCESVEVEYINDNITKYLLQRGLRGRYSPSTAWTQGGPIIERERIETRYDGRKAWCAWHRDYGAIHGPTLLIAAMRCFVASVLGDEVEIPEELI